MIDFLRWLKWQLWCSGDRRLTEPNGLCVPLLIGVTSVDVFKRVRNVAEATGPRPVFGLCAGDVDEGLAMLEALAQLGTVSRVVVYGTETLDWREGRRIRRAARAQRRLGVTVTVSCAHGLSLD